MQAVQGARILLIISGGIAAYKSLELVRRLRQRGARVRAVMTTTAQVFVTPLAVGAITGERVRLGLLDQDEEHDIGHIRLARDCDAIVVAPATADILARMAGGHADDLATAVLLATDRPVLVAPAMNPRMWAHPATARNVARLRQDGIAFVGPDVGEMAEAGEAGLGRMAEPVEIVAAIERLLGAARAGAGPLSGHHVVVTTGPTREPIDPVRFITNRSSGKQGVAIAAAAARLGARVTLVSGPTGLADPPGVTVVGVETARQMLEAVNAALPADIAVCAAAVADWRVAEEAPRKIKKAASKGPVRLALVENPDILRNLSQPGPRRPRLVVGFAAETENVRENAEQKRRAKGCDWIVANDVSAGTGVFGGNDNTVHLVTAEGIETWPKLAKEAVAEKLMRQASERLRSHTAAE